MKKRMKKIKAFFCKFVNGTKGVISLFLALVMLPFISTALIIVESARYQSVLNLMDELLDCVGLSAMADFDNYLEKRFGLLAMAQDSSPSTKFSNYLSVNSDSLNNGLNLTSYTVAGQYPLSNLDVLENQLMEFSETTVLVETLYEGLNVDELLKDLYKLLKVEDLNKTVTAVSKVADVATDVTELINAAKDIITEHGKYKAQLSEYKQAASSFRDSAADLITELNDAITELEEKAKEKKENAETTSTSDGETGNAEEEEEEEIDLNDIYDEKDVKDAVKACKNARDDFKKEAGEMASAVSKMKSTIEKVYQTAAKISEDSTEAEQAIEKMENSELKEESSVSSSAWLKKIAHELISVIEDELDSSYAIDLQNQIQKLNSQKVLLGKVVCDRFSEGDSGVYYIDAYTSESQINVDFCTVELNSIPTTFSDILTNIIDKLNNDEANADEAQKNKLGNLLDVAGRLLKVTTVYNGYLDAHVSTDAFYEYDEDDVNVCDKLLLFSLTTIVDSGETFVESLTSLNILKLVEALAKFLVGLATFLGSIVAWVGKTCVGLVKLFINAGDIYDTLMLSAYGVYNMPCRTTYKEKSIVNYDYGDIFQLMGGTYGDRITGVLSDLATFQGSSGSGSDPGFRGAYSEYLLVGDTNELQNQSGAFFNIYMLRMVLDLGQIFTNNEVKLAAAAANVAGWIVYLVLILVEPMLDTLLLVNGQSIHLWKDYVYLTASGMPILVKVLPSLTGLSEETKSLLKDSIDEGEDGQDDGDEDSKDDDKGDDGGGQDGGKEGNAGESLEARGKLLMSYQEHMMLMMLLSVDKETLLFRTRNLIQMETAQYYKSHYTFDLDEAYSYIKVTADGTFASMFQIDSLTGDGLFTANRTRYIGY